MKTILLTFSPCMNNIASCISPDVSHHPVAPVCQADTSATAPSTTSTSTAAPTTTTTSCPSEWTEFQGGCYRFYGSYEQWFVADASCLVDGARLTSVHSWEEQHFLNDLSNGNNYWIGGYPSDNTWVWSDFTNFDFDNSYSVSHSNCLIQEASQFEQGWSSAYCNGQYAFICKLVI